MRLKHEERWQSSPKKMGVCVVCDRERDRRRHQVLPLLIKREWYFKGEGNYYYINIIENRV